MTRTEAKLEGHTIAREEPVKEMSHTDHLRTLMRALPNADNPTEHAVFAAVFVRELATSSPGTSYRIAMKVLEQFRQADALYKEGYLEK